jgi:vacuolar-type H+-ATPase subunit H
LEAATEPGSSSRLVAELKSGIAETFANLERQATEIVTDAETRGRAIVEAAERQAEERAAEIVALAEERARETLEEAEREAETTRQRIQREAHALRSRLQTTLSDLHGITGGEPAQVVEDEGADAPVASDERAPTEEDESPQRRLGGILKRQQPEPSGRGSKNAAVEEKLARMAVKKMASAGASRDQLVHRVSNRFQVEDAEAIVDDVLEAGAGV